MQVRLKVQIKAATLTPEQTWLEALETNSDVATVVALRNSDVHSLAIRATNQRIEVQIEEFLPPISDSVTFVVRDADGNIKQTSSSIDEPSAETSRPSHTSTEFFYLLDPATLPPDFMTADRDRTDGRIPGQKVPLRRGDQLPLKPTVIAHLSQVDLGDIAVRSYAELRKQISDGRGLGFNL